MDHKSLESLTLGAELTKQPLSRKMHSSPLLSTRGDSELMTPPAPLFEKQQCDGFYGIRLRRSVSLVDTSSQLPPLMPTELDMDGKGDGVFSSSLPMKPAPRRSLRSSAKYRLEALGRKVQKVSPLPPPRAFRPISTSGSPKATTNLQWAYPESSILPRFPDLKTTGKINEQKVSSTVPSIKLKMKPSFQHGSTMCEFFGEISSSSDQYRGLQC